MGVISRYGGKGEIVLSAGAGKGNQDRKESDCREWPAPLAYPGTNSAPLDEEAPMSTMNRRDLLRSLLTGTLQTAGTVVLACSALPAALAQASEGPPAEGDLQERADRLASEEGAAPAGQQVVYYGGG